MFHDKIYGLFLGASILHGFLDHNDHLRQKLKQHFNLDVIDYDYRKGKTLEFLASQVFPRKMAEIINENDNDAIVDVFLTAGAVDLSDAISDDLDFDFNDFIARRNRALWRMLDHPFVRHVYFFPITPRKICNGRLSDRFPKYSKNDWISLANISIAKINAADFQFHSKLKLVPPIPDFHHHLANDGIHLTDKGKHLLLHSVFKCAERQMFSHEDFPPLGNSLSQKSPLQPIDHCIASKEKALRDNKKDRQREGLIEDRSKIHLQGSNHNYCERSSGFVQEKQRVVLTTKSARRRSKRKKIFFCDIGCNGDFDCFLSCANTRKSGHLSGEDKIIAKMVKNIMRKKLCAKNVLPWFSSSLNDQICAGADLDNDYYFSDCNEYERGRKRSREMRPDTRPQVAPRRPKSITKGLIDGQTDEPYRVGSSRLKRGDGSPSITRSAKKEQLMLLLKKKIKKHQLLRNKKSTFDRFDPVSDQQTSDQNSAQILNDKGSDQNSASILNDKGSDLNYKQSYIPK